MIKFLSTNQWYVVATILSAALVFYAFGCQSTVPSLIQPEKAVNRGELQAELNYLVQLAESRAEDLDQKDALKQKILDAGSIISEGGTVNPTGALNFITSIAAIAFGLDRNKKLKEKKEEKT